MLGHHVYVYVCMYVFMYVCMYVCTRVVGMGVSVYWGERLRCVALSAVGTGCGPLTDPNANAPLPCLHHPHIHTGPLPRLQAEKAQQAHHRQRRWRSSSGGGSGSSRGGGGGGGGASTSAARAAAGLAVVALRRRQAARRGGPAAGAQGARRGVHARVPTAGARGGGPASGAAGAGQRAWAGHGGGGWWWGRRRGEEARGGVLAVDHADPHVPPRGRRRRRVRLRFFAQVRGEGR